MSESTDAISTPIGGSPFAAMAASAPRRKLGPNYFKLFGASAISNLGDGIGLIAYPWLASAVTRNPLLIALVAVVQRLPWLLFSLPAGVITDRYDRRTLMVLANSIRAVLTLGVAFVVLGHQGMLPSPDEIDAGAIIGTDVALYVMVLAATLLLGFAEVLYDNSAQTFMPTIVHKDNLEVANGRLWSVEQVANTFVGPPLAALLLVVAFSVPFFVDAATFFVSAALIALIPATKRLPTADISERKPWKAELSEGFSWLWAHDLLRPMAIVLGLLNMLGTMSIATIVLFAQEVLVISPTQFALLQTGGALGGVIGGWTASAIAKKIGSGPSLYLTLTVGGTTTFLIGFATNWLFVWLMFAVFMLFAILWNVITVSLRQSIIPDHLLGRVNGVYRFFAWGMMPIGAALGGITVAVTDVWGSRELSLRMPFFIAGGLNILLFFFARSKLTTAKIDAARAAAVEEEVANDARPG
ncbi:MAG: MFS family permease [Candidatus Aldehydirespiratoraceae bacterium]|jgi:MFS family permease